VTVLSCAAARRQLEALHDGELPVAEQIAVEAHVAGCPRCATAVADLQTTREALRMSAIRRASLSDDECVSLQAAVVNRISAEEAVSLRASLRDMFEDMHFVYAGLGAATAVCLCAVITLGMLRSATGGGPSAIVALAQQVAYSALDLIGMAPGSDSNPISVDKAEQLPRSVNENENAFATAVTDEHEDGEHVMLTFLTVITRDGRVGALERLQDAAAPQAPQHSDEARFVQNLTGAASRARFAPASREGLPVAVNMVWVVAHTTVRASTVLVTVRPPAARRRA
jgi:hypothetical protein